MAISDTQKVDYLWKKVGYAATKTDTTANKEGYNEAIPSPLQIRGDKVMTNSGEIPGTIPGANTSIVTVFTTSLPIECVNDATASTNRTWKTNLTDWIGPEFGSTYQAKVYVNLSNSAGNAATAGTQLFASGSGNNDEWFFDYQSGVLNFIGTNLPSGVSFTGKSVYVSGARYIGAFGVSAPGGGGSVGNLTISNVTISANTAAVSSSANIIISTTGTGAVQFSGNNAIGLPVGNIANRPTTVNAGYLRFNTEFETIEVWDGAEWVQTSGGVITSDVLNGDGITTQFALSANTTTTGVLVSINGTIQKPSTAYTVSNNVITFTEIPVAGDTIEVRKLAGGTISVNYGNADVAAFLTTYVGSFGNLLNGITATGNISTVGYFRGDGSQLSNLPSSYGNVNVAAYLSTNSYLTSTTANLSNYAYSANITTANVGIIGYIDQANTIQSNQITAANVGMKGYVDSQTYSNVQVTSYLAGNITVGNIAGKTNGFTLGYLEMPQVASGNVTLALTDSGKHFYNTTASPQTITIPSFANVAFGNGTVISIANQSTSNISVALQSGVILYLAGNATSAARTITSYGVATLLKVNTNTWFINGSGVA